MNQNLHRRSFLKWVGAGTAAVSLPVLAGCGSKANLLNTECADSCRGGTYFDRFNVTGAMLKRVIDKGLSRGGDFCDIYFQHTVTHWTGMEDGQVNRAFSSVDLGAGIRVLKGDATGFAYCEDLSEKALVSAAETAAAVADGSPNVRPAPLAGVQVPNYYNTNVSWDEIGINEKLPFIQNVDSRIRKRDDRIIRATLYLGDETTNIMLANSDGQLVEDYRPMATFWVTCVGNDNGRIETSSNSVSGRSTMPFLKSEVPSLADRVVDNTISMFSAVEPPSGELPVVLEAGNSGILLHEAIGHGMEADFNRKGISIYADRIGTRIASPDVTILDDGTNPGLRGTINVDDEGSPTEATTLVEKGILRSFMHDRISAKHYKLASTGSGRRQSFRYPPVPRMRNTYMISGPMDPNEIIASVKDGIYAETFANGEVNIGAGDFTFFLNKGRLIKNGKLTDVIKDANLIGSGPKVLEAIDMVGNNSTMMCGGGSCGKDGQFVPVGFGLPTVRAGAISIGGRNA